MWADLGALKMRRAEQLVTLFSFYSLFSFSFFLFSSLSLFFFFFFFFPSFFLVLFFPHGEPEESQQSSLERTRVETRVLVASKERYCRIEWLRLIRSASRLTEFVHLFLQCKLAVKMTPGLRAALEN